MISRHPFFLIIIDPIDEETREIDLTKRFGTWQSGQIIIDENDMPFFPNPYVEFDIMIKKGRKQKRVLTQITKSNRISRGVWKLQEIFPGLKKYKKLKIHRHDYNAYEIIL